MKGRAQQFSYIQSYGLQALSRAHRVCSTAWKMGRIALEGLNSSLTTTEDELAPAELDAAPPSAASGAAAAAWVAA